MMTLVEKKIKKIKKRLRFKLCQSFNMSAGYVGHVGAIISQSWTRKDLRF